MLRSLLPLLFLTAMSTAIAMPQISVFSETGAPRLTARQAVWGPQADYAEFRGIALHILEKYPPDQYLYVGMGRSPVALIALLKAMLGEEIALNLPLSGMVAAAPENTWSREALAAHVGAFLPPEKIQGRKVLLIDYTWTGRSLTHALQEIAPLLPTPLEGFALTGKSETLARLGTHGTVVSPKLFDHLISRVYRGFSEYEQFFLYESEYAPPLKRGNEFAELVEMMRVRAGLDPQVSQFLSAHHPHAELLTSRTLLKRLSCLGRLINQP